MEFCPGSRTYICFVFLQEIASGDICNLNSAGIQDLGAIAYGLSVDQIACLNLDDDSTSALGELDRWSEAQVAHTFHASEDH